MQIALEDLDGQVAKFESEIDAVRQREDRDRSLLAAGTVDAKQLTELQHELETLERRQSSLEDSLLEVMERREELQSQQAGELAEIDELQNKLAEAQQACDEARTEIDQLRHQSVSRRDELVSELDADLVALYERQRARGGAGAGLLQGRRCGACRIEIDQRRAGAHRRGRRGRRAALPGVWGNPVAGQGNRRVKVIVEADGGSRGNPGPAGYGAVVWSADHGAVLAESKQAIGRATNNVAEYRGLIAGLEEAAKLGATDVDVFDGLQACGGADVGPLEGQAPRHRRPASTGHGAVRRGSTTSPTPGSRARRTATPTGWPTRRWTPPPKSRLPQRRPSESQTPSSSPGWTGARGAPTRFLLLRHGQTELSTQRRYSGRGNPALTDVGRRQAEAAAQFLAQKGGIDGRHHLAAAARLRHGGDGGEGARPRRHRRPRPDRNGLRGMGRADVR